MNLLSMRYLFGCLVSQVNLTSIIIHSLISIYKNLSYGFLSLLQILEFSLLETTFYSECYLFYSKGLNEKKINLIKY